MKRAKTPTSTFRLGPPTFKATLPFVPNLWNIAIILILALHLFAYFYFASGRTNEVGCLPRHASSAQKAGSQRPPPKFMVYRLIGNNMPPLQCPSQLLWNTQVGQLAPATQSIHTEMSFPSILLATSDATCCRCTEQGLMIISSTPQLIRHLIWSAPPPPSAPGSTRCSTKALWQSAGSGGC